MVLIIEAIILGIIQGLTEFLPISSSGHLILAQWATGWEGELIGSLTFDVALHVGTLAAVLWYFWRDWVLIGKAVLKTARGRAPEYESRLVWYIGLATIPAVIAGFLFEHAVETVFRNPLLVAAALAAGAVVMWLADQFAKQTRRLGDLTLGHALFVGAAQALALVPGVSRSGITISAGLAAGYRREDSARFSFLLSTPVIAGAAILKVRHIDFQGHAAWGCILGTLGSAVVGYLAIRFLIRYLERHSLRLFVWYRLAVAGAAVLIWMLK